MKSLVIDDHAIVRSSLRELLTNSREVIVIEARSGEEALAVQERKNPEFVILDLNLPDVRGFDLLRRLLDRERRPRVLVFSMYQGPIYATLALKYGAKGYASKAISPQELTTAIDRLMLGMSYVEPEIAQQLAAVDQGCQTGELTNSERDLLRLLAAGMSYSEIANSWGLAYKTVANLAGQIRSRLKLSSTAELIRFAIELNR